MAGNDIYGYNANYVGVSLLQAKHLKLTVSSGGTVGNEGGQKNEYLVQGVNFTNQRTAQILRELGSGVGYRHGMPPIGMMTIDKIVGKSTIASVLGAPGTGMWKAPGAGESTTNGAKGRDITLETIGNAPAKLKYTFHGCIIENLSTNVDVNSNLVRESASIRFGRMGEE